MKRTRRNPLHFVQFELQAPYLLVYKEASTRGKARAFLLGLKIGRTTEGTLGRRSSAVANHARRSVGGGVSVKITKLATVPICTMRATKFSRQFILCKIFSEQVNQCRKLRIGLRLWEKVSYLPNQSPIRFCQIYTICVIWLTLPLPAAFDQSFERQGFLIFAVERQRRTHVTLRLLAVVFL